MQYTAKWQNRGLDLELEVGVSEEDAGCKGASGVGEPERFCDHAHTDGHEEGEGDEGVGRACGGDELKEATQEVPGASEYGQVRSRSDQGRER